MRAQEIKEDEVLRFVWENSDVLAYVRRGDQCLGARRFGALPRNGRESKMVFVGRSRATVYVAWRLHHDERETVREHAKNRMEMLVLRDDYKAAYVIMLAKIAQNAKAGPRSNDWLGYCMLSWSHQRLRLLDGSKVWRNATKFGSRHRTALEPPFFCGAT